MSQPAEAGATRAPTPPPDPKDAPTGQLIGGLAGVQADVETVKHGMSR